MFSEDEDKELVESLLGKSSSDPKKPRPRGSMSRGLPPKSMQKVEYYNLLFAYTFEQVARCLQNLCKKSNILLSFPSKLQTLWRNPKSTHWVNSNFIFPPFFSLFIYFFLSFSLSFVIIYVRIYVRCSEEADALFAANGKDMFNDLYGNEVSSSSSSSSSLGKGGDRILGPEDAASMFGVGAVTGTEEDEEIMASLRSQLGSSAGDEEVTTRVQNLCEKSNMGFISPFSAR